MSLVAIVTPVYEDQESFAELCKRLAAAERAASVRFHVIAVDDGSLGAPPKASALSDAQIAGEILRLARNVGHQGAIAIGLARAAALKDLAACVVMDPAKLVAYGEVLVGLGLIVGALVGVAAFFGTLMNFSFMLAGTTSTNPVLFGLAVFLVLAWKVAGYWGLDRYLLPALGTPWQKEGTALAPEAVIPGGLSTGRR